VQKTPWSSTRPLDYPVTHLLPCCQLVCADVADATVAIHMLQGSIGELRMQQAADIDAVVQYVDLICLRVTLLLLPHPVPEL
jgi:hypothetical protein